MTPMASMASMTTMATMAGRLTSKRNVLVLLFTAASVILISGSRQWVSGSVDDAVLGTHALQGAGADVAPGAMAAALVGLASAVAAATSGPVVRVVATGAALLAAVTGAAVVISVLLDPGVALGTLAAAGTGRSGTLVAHGRVEGWAWVALAAMLAMAVASLGSFAGGRRTAGTAGTDGGPAGGQESAGSSWDQLSRGYDPTDPTDPTDDPTLTGWRH